MAILGMCCRLVRCLRPRTPTNHERGRAADVAQNPGDDLTRIKGIGIVVQDHLYKAGVRTYGDLAAADPATIAQAVGQQNAKSKIADWIAQAQRLRPDAN